MQIVPLFNFYGMYLQVACLNLSHKGEKMAKANDVEKKSQQDIELERFRKRLSYIKDNYSGEDFPLW